jgi:hypothetical protein
MSFLGLLVTNYVGQFIVGTSTLYMMYLLLNKKFRLTRRLILSYPIFILCFVLIATVITYPAIQKQGYFGAELHILTMIIDLVMSFLFLVYLFKKSVAREIFNSLPFTLAITKIVNYPLIFLISRFIYFGSFGGYVIIMSLTNATVILVMYFIAKTKLINYGREAMKLYKGAFIITSIYLVTSFVLEYYALNQIDDTLNEAMVILAVGYIVIICSIAIFSREVSNKRERKQSEMLLLQHQLYTNRLENIQQELRLFQHDYKNMVAGLYAQADEGNTQAVKDYINDKILNINDDVQNDIRQTNQLVKLTNMELKGLLLVKLMEAKKVDVTIDLEVLYEVGRISIETSDLLRCLGILLDNAIEAAQATATKNVSAVILQEDKTTIIVTNDISNNVDMSSIWKNGYSTKGKNRGLGLSSYQKILNNYDNAFCETKIADKQFTQILIIT